MPSILNVIAQPRLLECDDSPSYNFIADKWVLSLSVIALVLTGFPPISCVFTSLHLNKQPDFKFMFNVSENTKYSSKSLTGQMSLSLDLNKPTLFGLKQPWRPHVKWKHLFHRGVQRPCHCSAHPNRTPYPQCEKVMKNIPVLSNIKTSSRCLLLLNFCKRGTYKVFPISRTLAAPLAFLPPLPWIAQC